MVSASYEVGEMIEKGDRITLFVSRCHTQGSVKVRDYRGMQSDAAIRRLMMDGLSLGEVISVPSIDAEGGVIGQSLLPDIFVRWGTKIDLKIAERQEVSGFFNGDNPLPRGNEDREETEIIREEKEINGEEN